MYSLQGAGRECSLKRLKDTHVGREFLRKIPAQIKNVIDKEIIAKGIQDEVELINLRFNVMNSTLDGGYGWKGSRYLVNINLHDGTELVPSKEEGKAANIYSRAYESFEFSKTGNLLNSHCIIQVSSARKCLINRNTKVQVLCIEGINQQIQIY